MNVLKIGERGQYFATRHAGRQIYDEAAAQLNQGQDQLTLDFEGVQAITVTFADELVANLVVRYRERILLAGTDRYVFEAIETALAERRDRPGSPGSAANP